MSDEEFPDLQILLRRPDEGKQPQLIMNPRRSPRKRPLTGLQPSKTADNTSRPIMIASAGQQQLSPTKRQSPTKRSPLKPTQPKLSKTSFGNASTLKAAKSLNIGSESMEATAENKVLSSRRRERSPIKVDEVKTLLQPLSSQQVEEQKNSLSENNVYERSKKSTARKVQPSSAMSRITQAAKKGAVSAAAPKQKPAPVRLTRRGNQFVLREARCEDLDESSGSDREDEDEDTDLSGFIVDDNEDLSFEESPSESEREAARQRRKRGDEKAQGPRRRLQRGRKRQVLDSDDDENATRKEDDTLSTALQNMNLGETVLSKHKDAERRRTIEVVDLTSSPVQPDTKRQESAVEQPQENTKKLDVFDNFKDALRLQPSSKSQPSLLPSKNDPLQTQPLTTSGNWDSDEEKQDEARYTTPPATPPRSPTKLKSPSKLLSPSKRTTDSARSPHRQSMDAFWDHNVINEWNDQFSPKKAPAASPKKNPLARFSTWSDSEDDLSGGYNESSDSLPSPCESPSKPKARGASPTKEERLERQRNAEEKKAKVAAKKAFEARRNVLAIELLNALDENVTDSRISTMSASTGGVNITWSKTLRSTAGRANWKRTVTKSSGSPIKASSSSSLQNEIESRLGIIVQHFANIELAEKVIDREDRLVNTLAHEFCHLANFMVSGVRDQPHGDSFKRWAAKVTKWMRQQSDRPEWSAVEVTTKHGYVVETKYLWICAGRKQNLAMKMLNIEAEEEGCGAEYGRHSKSIDVETQRCGRCKGRLVQVRPQPRASGASSPRKNRIASPVKKKNDIEVLEKMIEVVELSD